MALRAGYYGVKKSFIKLVETLSTGKLIKTIGDGLNLSPAAKLTVKIDTDYFKFINGILTLKDEPGSTVNYSTTEQATGQKWVDGKDIYFKTWYFENGVDISGTSGNVTVDDVSFIDTIIDALFVRPASGSTASYTGRGTCGVTSNTAISPRIVTGLTSCKYITLYYTKKEGE